MSEKLIDDTYFAKSDELAPEEDEEEEEKHFNFEIPSTSYAEVIGLQRPKLILHKMIELAAKHPDKMRALNLARSSGLIFYGPPGTGKTLLSQAVAGELKLKMCYVNISDITHKWVGQGARNAANLFMEAEENEPCLLFFDEIDALFGDREKGNENNEEDKKTKSELLARISKVHEKKDKAIFIVGATNIPWSIDGAFLRSGRIETHLYIGTPNFWERRKLIRFYLKSEDKSYMGHINYTLLSLATIGYSPADIEKICKVAKLNALDRNIYKNKPIRITTFWVQRALKSKEGGKSSLDAWYLAKRQELLGIPVPLWKQLFRAIFRRKKAYQPDPKEKGKFGPAELETYKDLVNDIKNYARWRYAITMVRVFGRGL